MGIEIERKFLVKSDEWKSLGKSIFYKQGYLLSDKNRTIRIRTIDDKGFITIKSSVKGISRNEFEYEIPVEEARVILETLCEKPFIKKYRTKIQLNELVWEVDEFIDENDGLVIAEVELENENQKIDIPNWIGEEVSGDKKYFNSMLVKNPFTKW
ncbi:MAG: CYTH domain-containing protein [Ignavibacteriales bacterium]|nr:MAG: CYTH domain-containing protein [Ignavibacteriales bacterium]